MAWTDLVTVWAEERPTTGKEVLRSAAQIAEGTTILVMRYRPGITPTMRAVRGTRILDIQDTTDVDGRNRELQLLCIEVVR